MKVGAVLAGRYELREALGAGPIARVFQAWDRDTRQAVTLKLFDVTELPADAFTRHAAALQKARAAVHPALVLPRGPASAGPPRFLISEALKGSSLEAIRARDGALLWPRAAEIVAACADALAALHKATGLAHRALKPSNLWLTDASQLRVLDLGIAELGSHAVPARGSELHVEYRAPEQLEGAPGDPRSDVFTLGVLLFELATGVHPFSGPTAFRAAHTILARTKTALAADIAGAPLPKQAQRLIERALARRPEERFAGPAEFLYSLTIVRQAAGTSLPRAPKRPSPPVEAPPPPAAPEPALHATTMIRVPGPRTRAASAAVESAEKAVDPAQPLAPQVPADPQESGPPLLGAGSEAPVQPLPRVPVAPQEPGPRLHGAGSEAPVQPLPRVPAAPQEPGPHLHSAGSEAPQLPAVPQESRPRLRSARSEAPQMPAVPQESRPPLHSARSEAPQMPAVPQESGPPLHAARSEVQPSPQMPAVSQERRPRLHAARSEAMMAAPRADRSAPHGAPKRSPTPVEEEQATCVFVAPVSRDRTELLGPPPDDFPARLTAAREPVDATLVLPEPATLGGAEFVEATVAVLRAPVDATLVLPQTHEPTERLDAPPAASPAPLKPSPGRRSQGTLIMLNLLLVSIILLTTLALIMR